MSLTSDRKASKAKLNRLLKGLLKSPKTRAGLIAAAKTLGVSANAVYGWLAARGREGVVFKYISGKTTLFTVYRTLAQEHDSRRLDTEHLTVFPEWMQPKFIPPTSTHRIHLCSNEQDDDDGAFS